MYMFSLQVISAALPWQQNINLIVREWHRAYRSAPPNSTSQDWCLSCAPLEIYMLSKLPGLRCKYMLDCTVLNNRMAHLVHVTMDYRARGSWIGNACRAIPIVWRVGMPLMQSGLRAAPEVQQCWTIDQPMYFGSVRFSGGTVVLKRH